jgi:hypothetical protein
MDESRNSKFIRIRTSSSRVCSICRECVAKVATAKFEADLDKLEREHVCVPWANERYGTKPELLRQCLSIR